MKYSQQEIIQYVQEEDVKFIRLAFCDIFGKQKNISIMPDELPKAFTYALPLMHLRLTDLVMKPTRICFSTQNRTPSCRCPGDQKKAVWCGCSVTLPTQMVLLLNMIPV